MTKRRTADSGDVVLGWLTKLVVVLSLLGILAFDGISLLHARVSVSDSADQAAVAARDAWQDTTSVQLAYAAARSTATQSGGTVADNGMVIEPDGTVRVVVHKTARTFVLRHLGRLNAPAHVTGHGRAHVVK